MDAESDDRGADVPDEIGEQELIHILKGDLTDILSLAGALVGTETEVEINRRFVGRYHLEATKMEEILDAFGAKENEFWYPFRNTVAIIKNYTKIVYSLLHVKHCTPFYRLLNVDGDFEADLQRSLDVLNRGLLNVSRNLILLYKRMKMEEIVPLREFSLYRMEEPAVTGRVPRNIAKKATAAPHKTGIYLASHFLHLSHEGDELLSLHKNNTREQYRDLIPDNLNETLLNALANKFHNLQSLYDTHLHGSDLAEKDDRLPVMRGQISAIYHLTGMATNLLHNYERHSGYAENTGLPRPLETQEALNVLFEFMIAYSYRYIIAARELCHHIIRDYAEKDSVTVPVPRYRGFHVRPSTLISRIVLHYGSDVTMSIGNEVYNAAVSMDLFRANEMINAEKRKEICAYLIKNDEHFFHFDETDKITEEDIRHRVLRRVLYALLTEKKVVIYDSEIDILNITPTEGEPLFDYVKRSLAYMMAMGKIDVHSEARATFCGDKRVLNDLRILAENGYGEDQYGKNILLPKQLSYLKRNL